MTPDIGTNRPTEVRIVGGWPLRTLGASADERIRELAAAQHGIVSRRQLLATGLSAKEIQVRRERGQIRALHRGIYTTNHGPLPPLAAETAALLASGTHAALSHITALNLWRLLPYQVPSNTIHLTTAVTGRGRRRPELVVHRTTSLTHGEVRHHHGLPITSPERTLLDCAPLLDHGRLEKALDEALTRHITSLTKLNELLSRHRHGRGQALLTQLVSGRERPTVTKEEAEARFLQLIRAAGLPDPHTQVMLCDQSVDAYWPDSRFAVEIDSIMWHNNPQKFNRDRRKEQILRDHGVTLSRATWHQINHEPLQLLAHVALQIGLGRQEAA